MQMVKTVTIPTPQGIQTFSAAQITAFSKELNIQISENGARTPAEAALPALLNTMKGAMADPLLSGICFETLSAVDVVNAIGLSGSKIQRAAFAQYLTPVVGYAFPGIYEISKKNEQSMLSAIKFISEMILAVCQYYGVEFKGDVNAVAYTIIRDYGGFSIADFLLFFERCKAGEYRQEFQHISSRGINFDYLKSWLDQYAEEREVERQGVHYQYREARALPGGEGEQRQPVVVNYYKQMEDAKMRENARRNDLEFQADKFRKKWTNEIFDTQIIDGYPMQVDRDGAACRLLRRTIYEYVCFCDAKATVEFYEQVVSSIERKYGKDFKEYEVAEMKAIVSEVTAFKNAMPATKLAELVVGSRFPDATGSAVIQGAVNMIRELEGLYYAEYLPSCIDCEYPALSKTDFIWQSSLYNYAQECKKNPVREILSHEKI